MKRFIKYNILFTILLSIASCDFLEVEPVGKTTIPQLFSNMEGIRAALPGAYSAMYDHYEDQFTKYPDVAGDMLRLNFVGTTADMADQSNYTSDQSQETGAVCHIWTDILNALSNVKILIDY